MEDFKTCIQNFKESKSTRVLDEFEIIYVGFLYKLEYIYTILLDDNSKYGFSLIELDNFIKSNEQEIYLRIEFLLIELKQYVDIHKSKNKSRHVTCFTDKFKLYDGYITNIDNTIRNIMIA